MPEKTTDHRSTNHTTGSNGKAASRITPEMVAAVADKVYAMLLRDLRLEFERQRWLQKTPPRSIGGK